MSINISFKYGKMGHGELLVWEGSSEIMSLNARTGSISGGKLKNAIPVGVWYGMTAPESTEEVSMVITKGCGWKWRLFDQFKKYTRYLIHPDGNLPGTEGCIGLFGDCLELKRLLGLAMGMQEHITVCVYKE